MKSMMSRWVFPILLLAAATALAGDGTSLTIYLARALDGHPALESLSSARASVAASRSSATALPEPELSLGWMVEPVETRVGPQRYALGLRQSLPWFGTLGLRGREVDARTAEADARLAARRLAILQEVQTAWFELAWLGRAVETTREHLQLVTGWEEVARARYAAGEGAYEDLMRIQIELGAVEDRLRALRDREPAYAAALNAAAGLPVETPVETPMDIPEVAPLPADAELYDLQRRHHPDLRAADARADLFAARQELAGKAGYPRLSLGLDWIATDPSDVAIPDSGKDPLVARLGLSLPIWRGSYGAQRDAAAAGAAAVAAERRDLVQTLQAALSRAVVDHRDAESRAALYRGTLLPRARQAFDALLSAYGAGEAGYLDLVDAARTRLEFALARDRALADRGIAEAVVHALTGGAVPLTHLPDRPAEEVLP
jgi:outer membrane protein TolC